MFIDSLKRFMPTLTTINLLIKEQLLGSQLILTSLLPTQFLSTKILFIEEPPKLLILCHQQLPDHLLERVTQEVK